MLKVTKHLDDYIHQNEKTQFSAIYDEWRLRLCYFAFLQLKNMESAEDVVQDCFISLWIRENALTDILSIKSYLYRSVYNACINKIKVSRKVFGLEESIPIIDNDEDIEACIMRAELYGKLYNAVEKIPDKCSQVIKLYYFERLKIRAIAEKLNITIYTVKSRRQRGIAYLRRYVPGTILLLDICLG